MAQSLRRPFSVLVAASLLLPAQALAWGGAGHRLIGDLAMRN